MTEKPIRVSVYDPGDRKFLCIKWKSPETGEFEKESTGTAVRRDAERYAAKRGKEPNDGAERPGRGTKWKAFRERVERDFLPRKRESTQERYTSVVNSVERHLKPNLMTGLNADAIGRFEAALRERGNAAATVATQLRHLTALLRWGNRHKLVLNVPHIEIAKPEAPARGRPITDAGFDKLPATIPEVAVEARAESWRHLSRGLYAGGLRIGEATRLTWDDARGIRTDLDRANPLLFTPGRLQKGTRDTVTPITPDFAALLTETPKEARRGFVLDPVPKDGRRTSRLKKRTIELVTAEIGQKAGVVVKREPLQHATAHDMRRSFCFRWAQRVLSHPKS